MEMLKSIYRTLIAILAFFIILAPVQAAKIRSLKDALDLSHYYGNPVLIQFVHED